MSPSFGRSIRLRARAEFVAVQDHGRRVAARYMTFLALPTSTGVTRLGVVASRKLGGAVARNAAKRRVRELFRISEPERLMLTGSYDIVVIPRRELVAADFAELKTEFHAALNKLRR